MFCYRYKRQASIGDLFAPKGDFHAMDCADIVVGVAKGELGRVWDGYTRDRSTPKADTEYGGTDSLTAALAFEDDQGTTVMFR